MLSSNIYYPNTVDRKTFELKIFRAVKFCVESFSYEQPLTMHVNVNSAHAF